MDLKKDLLCRYFFLLKPFSMAIPLCISSCILFEDLSNYNYRYQNSQYGKAMTGVYTPAQSTLPSFQWQSGLKSPTAVSAPLKPAELRLINTEKLPIDLPTTLRLASAENLDIALAEASVQEAEGESDAARLNLLPTLSGSHLYRHSSGTLQATFGEIASPTFSTVNPEGVLRLSLNPGQAMYDALAAHRTFQATVSVADRVSQNTLLTATEQYFDLIKALSKVNIAEQAVTESKEFLRITEVLEKQGAGLKVDVYRAQAKLQGDIQALLSAQNEFRQASINLALTLHLDPGITLFPTDTAVRQITMVNPSLTLSQLVDIALAKRPEVLGSQQRVASAIAAKKAALWNAFGPAVVMEGSFGGIGKTFSTVDERSIVSGLLQWTLSGSTFGRIKSASARVSANQIGQEIVYDLVKSEVVKAQEEVMLTQEQIVAAEKELTAAEQSLKLSQASLKLGTAITLEVLQALEALTGARTRLVEAIIEYNKSQTRLLNSLGELSVDTLIRAATF